jgi:hypothetical protein
MDFSKIECQKVKWSQLIHDCFLAEYFASSMAYVMTLFQLQICVASNEVKRGLFIVELRGIGE